MHTPAPILEAKAPLPAARPRNLARRIRPSAEWVKYFERNARELLSIPWSEESPDSQRNLELIAHSLRGWQLGETSDGSHLLATAQAYAAKLGDVPLVRATELFIREEQRHGAELGRCLDLLGVPRAARNWGDTCFRACRHALPSMEIWATPVVMVETHATIYYQALRTATGLPALKTVCRQILKDEVPHIRFQCERLAALHRRRGPLLLALTLLLHRVFFTVMTVAVWVGHRRLLSAGGYPFGRFWQTSWNRMRRAWREMDSRRYDWAGGPQALPEAELRSQGEGAAESGVGG